MVLYYDILSWLASIIFGLAQPPDDTILTGMASKLENKFLLLWRANNGPSLEVEYKFCPERKFRADFAYIEPKILIEIEGGQWVMGRHQRGAGYAKDAEKYNIATALGWMVFRLTSSMVTPDYVADIVKLCKGLPPSKSFFAGRKIF